MKLDTPFNKRRPFLTQNGRAKLLGPFFVLLSVLTPCFGQGTMTVAFEGQPPGTFGTISAYSESGMQFWNPYGPQNLARVGSGLSGAPDNGTAYLQVTTGARLAFRFTDFSLFNLVSLDLAEYATSLPGPVSLHVVGYRNDMTTAITDITTDGINDGTGPLQDFQTFHFDSTFASLYQVEILTDRFSIDNVVVGIPEPSTGGLLLLGAACAFGRSRIKRRRP